MAAGLLARARDLGVVPWGVSFHVGSQQKDPGQWDAALAQCAVLFRDLDAVGIELGMVNLGGGFPTPYQTDVPDPAAYGEAILASVRRHFGNRVPFLIAEPGRGLVGNAGVISTEVVLIAQKGDDDPRRWVFLDIGKFGGLAETMDEAIRYPDPHHPTRAPPPPSSWPAPPATAPTSSTTAPPTTSPSPWRSATASSSPPPAPTPPPTAPPASTASHRWPSTTCEGGASG